MDQYLNNRQNDILWKLLANPADNGHLYEENLQQLANDFPQSGLLQALLARANSGEGMRHAAVSFNPKALYVIMNAYENLAEVQGEQIMQKLGERVSNVDIDTDEEDIADQDDLNTSRFKDVLDFEPHQASEELISDDKVIVGEDERQEVDNLAFQSEPEPVVEEHADVEPQPVIELEQEETETIPEIISEIEQPAEDHRTDMHGHVFEEETIEHAAEHPHLALGADVHEQVEEIPAEDHRAEMHSHVFEEEMIQHPTEAIETIAEHSGVHEEVTEMPVDDHRAELFTPIFEEEIIELPSDSNEYVDEVPKPSKDIEDEIYDEIVGIENISFVHVRPPVEVTVQPEITGASIDEGQYEDIAASYNETVENVTDTASEIEEPVTEDTSYFVFEKEERQPVASEEIAYEAVTAPVESPSSFEADTNNVSKYHDDKMPYTFMWWLDKTRKEHAGIYQPFKLDTTQAIKHTADGTLQQQYYENIFHITTVEELNNATDQQTIEFDMKNKEDRLIKKFIVEEPHISTPSGDKLDNENKAKKSAEDQDEMVTETLARIYVDQMLYHKAINTYKKLILKFPEKSRYFADQIELLERKIN